MLPTHSWTSSGRLQYSKNKARYKRQTEKGKPKQTRLQRQQRHSSLLEDDVAMQQRGVQEAQS